MLCYFYNLKDYKKAGEQIAPAFLFGVNQESSGFKEGGEMNSLDASLDSLLIQYRLSLEAANGSPKTFQGYSDILRRFFGFLEKKGHVNSVSDIDREEVEAYTRSLQNAKRWPNRPQNGEDRGKLSPVTVQDHVRAIKAFWSWLLDNGYIEKNTLAKFPLPKIPKTIITTLTIEQIQQLLQAIDKQTSVGVRNYCIILFMIDNGMRISEVVSIRISDIDLFHSPDHLCCLCEIL